MVGRCRRNPASRDSSQPCARGSSASACPGSSMDSCRSMLTDSCSPRPSSGAIPARVIECEEIMARSWRCATLRGTGRQSDPRRVYGFKAALDAQAPARGLCDACIRSCCRTTTSISGLAANAGWNAATPPAPAGSMCARVSWSAPMLAATDPDRDLGVLLPPLVDADRQFRSIAASVADANSACRADVRISSGGGDNMMAAIGTGNVEPGMSEHEPRHFGHAVRIRRRSRSSMAPGAGPRSVHRPAAGCR